MAEITDTTTQSIFRLGPDRGILPDQGNDGEDRPAVGPGDLRENRPYFLVPLDEGKGETEQVRKRIADWLKYATQEPSTLLITAQDIRRPRDLVAAFQAADRATDSIMNDAPLLKARSFLLSLMSRQTRLLIATVPTDLVPSEVNEALAILFGDMAPDIQTDAASEANIPDPGAAVLLALVRELNTLMIGHCLYDAKAFPDALLPEQLQELVKEGKIALLADGALRRVNRMLIEIAVDGVAATPYPWGTAAPLGPPPVNGSGGNGSGSNGGAGPILKGTQAAGLVSDIYVMSHGWHRNFFAAVAAYDRLMSRTSILLHRRRLRSGRPFHPLFLMLHWHSDPGNNGWIDRAGMRSRDVYMRNVEMRFDRPSAENERFKRDEEQFTTVFEDAFQLMAKVSAADTNPHHPALKGDATALARRLNAFVLRDAASAGLPDKIASLWCCYTESPATRPLMDQDQAPERFNSIWQSAVALTKFIFAAGGMAILIYLATLPHARQYAIWLWESLGEVGNDSSALLRSLPGIGIVWRWLLWLASFPLKWVALQNFPFANITALLAICAAVLGICWVWNQESGNDPEARQDDHKQANGDSTKVQHAHGMPVTALLAWAPLQVAFLVPLIFYSFIHYFVGGIFAFLCRQILSLIDWVWRRCGGGEVRDDYPFLYDERYHKQYFFRRRNEEFESPNLFDDPEVVCRRRKYWYLSNLRLLMSGFARLPILVLRASVSPDTPLPGVVEALDAQLAFWEMQIRGVDTGDAAARFLATLWPQIEPYVITDDTGEPAVRVHLIGHSFGGLVVANMVRHLCLDRRNHKPEGNGTVAVVPEIASLTLLQGAMASSWFEREEKIRRYVRHCIACIFSGYDTANGFYYPLANGGRCAAGYVGLFRVGSKEPILRCPKPGDAQERALFASVVSPINLRKRLQERIAAMQRTSPQDPADQFPYTLNIDASRMIYNGSVLSGGGHVDIFKDDVVHLVWEITRLRPQPTALPVFVRSRNRLVRAWRRVYAVVIGERIAAEN